MAMENLTDILHDTKQRLPSQPAQRFWHQNRWQDRTYLELWEEVQAAARGMRDLGVAAGDRVGLMAKTRPEWVIADYAILMLDAITVPIYPSSTPDQVRHILEDAQIALVIVDNDTLAQRFPQEVRLLLFDTKDDAHSFAAAARPGEEIQPAHGRHDIATLVYTSGTTGLPKGVILTHGNLLANAEALTVLTESGPAMRITPEDVALAFLPLSHILERTGHNALLMNGVTLAYARSTDQLPDDLLQVRPTIMIAVPRVFEKIYGRVMAEVGSNSPIARALFRKAVAAGNVRYAALAAGRPAGVRMERQARFYDRLVFQKVRAAVGGRLRFVIAGGAPLAPEIGQFFFVAGITVLEGYGLTETAPVLTVNMPPVPRYGTVGQPLPGVEVRLAEDGEILARGPNVSAGYWNLPEDTAQAFDNEGWFRTGDIGQLSSDGYLSVTDRKKHILVLSTGKNVAPQVVEQHLILSPWIEQAVVLGNGRKYVSALLYLDPANYRQWAKKSGKASLDDSVLLKDPDLLAAVMSEVQKTCANLAAFERPKRVAFLPGPLSEENGELTPSLKVKLSVVEKRRRTLIESLYEEGGSPAGLASESGKFGWNRAVVAIGAGIVAAAIIRAAIH